MVRARPAVVVAIAMSAVFADCGLAAVTAARMARRNVDLGAIGRAIVGLGLLREGATAAEEAECEEDGQEAHAAPRASDSPPMIWDLFVVEVPDACDVR